MNLLSLVCGHVRTRILDKYPETPWMDVGNDSPNEMCRGTLKVQCQRCGNIHLVRNAFIHRNKFTLT